MAQPITCVEHIAKYSPEQVFEVGTRTDMLPEVHGLTLTPEADRFDLGVGVKVGLVVAHHNFQLDTAVTEFKPAERVLIEGKSHIGRVAVWLDLEPDEEIAGTQIGYGIQVRHSLLTKPAEPKVYSHLKDKAPEFAQKYRLNVVRRLEEIYNPRPTTSSRSRKKAA